MRTARRRIRPRNELQPEISDLQDEEAAAQRRHQGGAEHGADHRNGAPGKERPAEHRPEERGQSHISPPTAGIAAPSRATTIMPATPASTPESVWLMTMTRLTGTPDIAAARGLAPAARMRRPSAA